MEKSLTAIDALLTEANALPDKIAPTLKVAASKTEANQVATSLNDGLLTVVTSLFNTALADAFPAAKALGFENVQITRAAMNIPVDLQCNSAMSLFASLKKAGKAGDAKKPADVALALIAKLPPNSLIDRAELSGAGFINISLCTSVVTDTVVRIARHGPSAPCIKKTKVVVDFSSPNIAKEMHVGHLRSTIIGDTVCRMLEFCGCEVLRTNHVGDWGTQFGMLIQYLRETYPSWRDTPPNLTELTVFYKAAKKRFDEDEVFKGKARLNVPLLQQGDAECRAIWMVLCDISRLEFQKVYQRLNVNLTEVGESYYNPRIPGTLDAMTSKQLLRQEEGALCMFRDNWQYPLILRKTDGGYGYDSTDMAAISYRLNELKADWVIYITDIGQQSHFHMVFDAAKDAGWVSHQRLDHVGFGVVCGSDGKRFKTRSGETVRLVDLLDEAVVQMRSALNERKKEGKTDLSEEEINVAAANIGYGAVKYMDLKNNPTTNYVFSYERMLDTRGDTAVYLMFAYARLASIIRKAKSEKGADILSICAKGDLKLEAPVERALAFELMQMADVLNASMATLQPNRLCEYLYALSIKFTSFVTELQVIGSEQQDSRLILCEATRQTMALMFSLLGIVPPPRI